MAAFLDAFDHCGAVDTCDRRLARWIDWRCIDDVGVVKRGGKFIHVVAQTAKPMRLHHRDHAAFDPFARGGQHGADFDRVVAVIVDDRHRIAARQGHFADLGKAPLDPTEFGKAGADHFIGHAHFDRDSHRRQRILHVVPARHRHFDALDPAKTAITGAQYGGKTIAAGIGRHTLAPHVGLRRKTIGDDPAVAHLGDDRLHHRMVDAQHRRAIKRHVFNKFDEAILHPLERAIVVEVLRIDIGHHRNRAVQPQERAIALIRLDDHPVAGAEAGVRAIGIDDAAVDHRRIDAARIKQRGHHAGRRRLAMGAGDGHGVLQPHQFSQHFGAAHHRNAVFQCGDHFGIVALDRRASHHHRRIANVFSGMADHHLDAARAQALNDIALGNVRPLHGVAEVGHHFCNARHADAADADEMDGADVGCDTLHATCSCIRASADRPTRITSINGAPPKLSTRSARSSAARGWPQFHAAWAALANVSGRMANA